VSIISERTAGNLNLNITLLNFNERFRLSSANGTQISVVGTADIRLYFNGLIIPQTVQVSPNIQHSILLGFDFLQSHSVILNYKLGILSLKDDLVRVPLHSKSDDLNCVTSVLTTCIPAFTEAWIQVTSAPQFNDTTVLIEPLSTVQFDRFVVAKALVNCCNNRTVCQSLNCKPYPITLRKGMKLARIERINTIASIHKYEATKNIEVPPNKRPKQSRSQLEAFHKSYGFKINPELTEAQRYELLQLLFDYNDVFARSLAEIRECKAPPLRIDLHTPRKMFKRQFRLNDEDAKEVTRQIAEMEECGVIEPPDSAYYNSPVFLVKKRDGSKRLVVDLRGINSLIIPKLIQLPNIDELSQKVTQEKPIWLSILDVRSAYWQCPIEESRKYTSFCAPDGRRWRFRRAPFGLCSSPAYLLLILGNMFADKNKFRNLSIYMDDSLVHSPTWQNHLAQLELTLSAFLENRFSGNPKKTELAFHKLEYLGFVVSGEGIQMSKRRIEAIKHIYPPTNVKGLLKLPGMTNFWKRFIPSIQPKRIICVNYYEKTRSSFGHLTVRRSLII